MSVVRNGLFIKRKVVIQLDHGDWISVKQNGVVMGKNIPKLDVVSDKKIGLQDAKKTSSQKKEWTSPVVANVEPMPFEVDSDLHFFMMSVPTRNDVFIYVPLLEENDKSEEPVLDLVHAGYLTGPLWDGQLSEDHFVKTRSGSRSLLSLEDQGRFLSARYEVFRKKNPAGKIEEFEKRYVFDESFSPLVLLGREFYQRGNPRHQRLFDALNP